MLLTRENNKLIVYADANCLVFAQDRPFVYLQDAQGKRIAELFAISSIHPLSGRDDTTEVSGWSVEETLDDYVVTFHAKSSAWDQKTVRFRCQPRRFRYELEVHGSGQLAEVQYFGGYSSAQLRWGSGFFWSGQNFLQGFNPEPNSSEVYTFPAAGNSLINLTGVPLPGRADWFFTPPPFFFAFETGVETSEPWIGIGIEAEAGQNTYDEFRYHGSREAFYLSLSYDGHASVQGKYRLPAVSFDFGSDPYTLLASHTQNLRAAGLAPSLEPKSRPAWWYEPLFCGWGAQCALAKPEKGRAPDYATQLNYEQFLRTLSAHDVTPGTVVLDDKWQLTYGNNEVDPIRWPDLPGFIKKRHAAGQHVLLWIKAWDPEGVPTSECITNAAGIPIAVDPTNPAYERRLRASIRSMLSLEGYDADGFKIDFSARIPSGPGLPAWGQEWGLELMRRYLAIIMDEARHVKPDAFIITHTPHPYLAGLMDAIRLNDINTDHDTVRQMTHRARVAAIACPEALIDSDNWPIRSKADWRNYLISKPALGIPALYYSSHIDSTMEPLNEDDYDLIRQVWAEYRAAVRSHHTLPSEEKICELGGSYLPEPNRLVKRLALSSILPVATKPLKSWMRALSGGA